MELNTIHLALPNGDTFSIAELNGKHEVAVLRGQPAMCFVPVPEWSGMDYNDDVLPISGTTESLIDILGTAIAWANEQKSQRLAQALDQAL